MPAARYTDFLQSSPLRRENKRREIDLIPDRILDEEHTVGVVREKDMFKLRE